MEKLLRRVLSLPPVARRSVRLSAVLVLGAAVYNEWNGITLYSLQRHDTLRMVSPSRGGGDGANATTVSRHILLVRHGQYFQQSVDDKDRFLTPLDMGTRFNTKQMTQAELTGQILKDMGFHYSILISSSMTRAQETAEIIHKYLPQIEHVVDKSLVEVDIPPVGSWRKKPNQFFQDGDVIENTFRKYFKRADKDKKEDTFEIIVCHANVIRYFMNRTMRFQSEAWRRFPLPHCSITHIVIEPTGKVNIEAIAIRNPYNVIY